MPIFRHYFHATITLSPALLPRADFCLLDVELYAPVFTPMMLPDAAVLRAYAMPPTPVAIIVDFILLASAAIDAMPPMPLLPFAPLIIRVSMLIDMA